MTPEPHRPTATGSQTGPGGPDDGTPPPDLLLAEPDTDLAAKVVARFAAAGVSTVVCRDGAEALLQLGVQHPGAVLLSAPLPVVSAAQVTALIARLHPVPVIVGAGPDGAEEATGAVAAGAVAFVARPYRAEEILPLLMPRLDTDAEARIVVGDVELDVAGFHVYVRGCSLQLPVREFLLLRYFMERSNKLISRQELTAALWGTEKPDSNTLTVHVRRVRNKIQEAGSCCTIDAIRGMGYRFECGPGACAETQSAPTSRPARAR
ncbi:winged helix-turn-helix transcriptional regulator [Streptomyces regalis]|uniref:Two-component system response regulator n=1 Tax=Streptomyces regalis TaxID=68262 RepID=A0A0X3UN53_9ACTN|nr:response regulator transcription factor [Streptomyces regalis]KUL34048.1 two-component system response regulator [Streptomyces regalis]